MSTTSGITIDPIALRAARRELLRLELALTGVTLHPPDTGATTSLTAGALERVGEVVGSVTDDLRGLADGLERLLDDLLDQDGRVGAMFERMRKRADR